MSQVSRSWTLCRYPSARQVHLVEFSVCRQGACAVLELQCVYMDRSIGRLCCNKLVQRIPCHALDIVIVLCYLSNQVACLLSVPLPQPYVFRLPDCASYIRAELSIAPVMKYLPSGDHAKSYISAPVEVRHICRILHVSLSSTWSSPMAVVGTSDCTQSSTFPSSPADASSSPFGQNRTTLTVCVWRINEARKVSFASSPSLSRLHSLMLLSPPAVASRPLP